MNASPSPGRLQIARVLGIPIYLHFSWMIIFGLIVWTLATGYFPAQDPDLPAISYWAKGLVASLLFFVSILLHELGHAAVAQKNGIQIRAITLFIFGGVSQLEKDPQDGWTEFKMAAAGPIVSLVLAVFFGLGATASALVPSARAVARYLALINLSLALFNLVPAFPLDGGRLLRGLLWRSSGKVRATQVAASAGTFFAFSLIAVGVLSLLRGAGIAGVWYILIGWFLKEASAGAFSQSRLDEALRGVTVRDAMITDVATLPADISVAEAARDHFLHTGYGGYPVVRGDTVVGLLCLRDVLGLPPAEREATSVQAAMRPLGGRIVVDLEEPLLAAMGQMIQGGAGRLLVVQEGRFVGLLTMDSVIRHVRVREELAA